MSAPVDVERSLSWKDRGPSYKAPSGEHIYPSRFTPDGKPVYTYLRTPTAKEPFLSITLVDNRQQPHVRWDRGSAGALTVQSDRPIVEGETRVPLTLDLPTLRGGRVSFPIESGRFSVRNTREGLIPHTFLAPEVQDNGRHLYHSPEGTSLSFVLDDSKKDSPAVLWRQLPGRDQGEFFMVPAKGQELSDIYSSSRTTVELPVEGKENGFEREGSVVSVDNGLFHVRNGNHDVMYVAFDENVERVEAHGEAVGREAHMLITEGNFVKDLYLRGHTYVQTHDTKVLHRFMPPTDVIGTIHVGNGRADEFNNDRINGYELGLAYNAETDTYEPANYSISDLSTMERSGLRRERSGHMINLPRRNRAKARSVEDPPQTEEPVISEQSSHIRPPVPQGEDLLYITRGSERPRRRIRDRLLRRPVEPEVRIENPWVVIEPVHLQLPMMEQLRRNFDRVRHPASLERPQPDIFKTATVLTLVASQTAPEGMTNMLTLDALRLLNRQDLPHPLSGMRNIMRSNFDYIEDIIRNNAPYMRQMLREMDSVIREERAKREQPAQHTAAPEATTVFSAPAIRSAVPTEKLKN
jgi:hypothetical protein